MREESAALAFSFNPNAPITNNLAKRDLRPAKVKQKISNCLRTEHGARICARIEGFISSARKNIQNVFRLKVEFLETLQEIMLFQLQFGTKIH